MQSDVEISAIGKGPAVPYGLRRSRRLAEIARKPPIRLCGGMVKGKTIAVRGLTFKHRTGDIRGGTKLTIIPARVEVGAGLGAFNPEGRNELLADADFNYSSIGRRSVAPAAGR